MKIEPWWVTREWCPEETDAYDCVRCGVSMFLELDAEWSEDPAYNFCHSCAHELVEECMEKLNERNT